MRSTLLPVTCGKCRENDDFLTIFEYSQELSWSIRDHSRASRVIPRHHLNVPELISKLSILRPRSILMDQMWPTVPCSRLDRATGLENSDSLSKIISIELRVDEFHHDLMHENMGQRVTGPVYWRITTLVIWHPRPTGRRVLRTISL